MSVEEDVELRDLVAQTLEINGCLAKIRAQLRASIFLALDEDVKVSKEQPFLNNKIISYLETVEGRAMFCIVREFLEFFDLYFTMSVFEPESYLGKAYKYEGRQKIVSDLGLANMENTAIPVLLQLIKLVQTETKNIEINLNLKSSEAGENTSISQDIETTCNLKTDSNTSNSRILNEAANSNSKMLDVDVKDKAHNTSHIANLNVTFDLSNPTINLNSDKTIEKETVFADAQNKSQSPTVLDNTYSKNSSKDNTFEDTSSMAEDSIALNKTENSDSKVLEQNINCVEEKLLEEANEVEILQPVLKDSKIDKSKLSPQKSEKLKSKNSLTSLSDLPPLQLSKTRVSDILPSLYSKEFKDKSNLRELDKLFDMDAEYEEDFMCSGDDLSLKSDYLKCDNSKINLLDNLQITTRDKNIILKRDLKQNKPPNRIISDCSKPLIKPPVNNQNSKDSVISSDAGKGESSSNSFVSENLEISTAD